MHSTNISAMEEVKHAVTFIVKMFDIEEDLAVLFNKNLTELLLARVAETNFSLEKPQQGSARRCVRCEVNKLDPLILEAARLSDYKPKLEKSISFCVWIDPQDVSARLGDRGSVFVIMEGPLKQRQAPSSPAHHNSKLRSSSSSSFEESSTKKLSPSVARKLQFQQQQQQQQQQQFQHQHHHQQQQQMYHHHHHQQQHFSQHHDMYNSRVYYQQHQPVVSYSSNSPNSTSPFGSPRSSPTNSPPPSRNQSLWVPHYRQMTVVA